MTHPSIKRTPTLFLQAVIVLIGLGMLTFLLWEPHAEGVNAGKAFFAVYADPFIAYVYIASIPFFVALYQAFTLLRYIANNAVFSLQSVKALRTIKYCALAIIAFTAGMEAYIFIVIRGTDDSAGGVMMGLFVMFTSLVIATAAAVFEKLLQSAVEMKSENDLTV